MLNYFKIGLPDHSFSASQSFSWLFLLSPKGWWSKKIMSRGARVAQWAKGLTSTPVMISWLVSPSPALGSVYAAQSLESASESMPTTPPPPLPLPRSCSACLSLSKVNIKKNSAYYLSLHSTLSSTFWILTSFYLRTASRLWTRMAVVNSRLGHTTAY